MTIRDYITDKLATMGLTLTAADWSDIAKAVDPDAPDTDANIGLAMRALAIRVLPFYIRRAMKSVSENGFSITFDGPSLLYFYGWLCDELGIDSILGGESVIEDISYM